MLCRLADPCPYRLLHPCPQYPDLAENDLVKIDLGAHIDGHIVLAAHTLIVGVDLSNPETAQSVATGRRAAVINAAYTAAEVAAKLIKNGTSVLAVCCSCWWFSIASRTGSITHGIDLSITTPFLTPLLPALQATATPR